MMSDSPLMSSGMAHVNEVLPATNMLVDKWNESSLPILHSHTASLPFGLWYPVPIHLIRLSWPGWLG